jgi:hypothetical protein
MGQPVLNFYEFTLFRMDKLLRIAAICSVIGAVTTLVLALIPEPVAESFDKRVLLYKNGIYSAKHWIFFFHSQLNIIAVLGVTVFLVKRKPYLVLIGLLFFLVWGITECAQHAFLIDAVNQYWRPQYLSSTEEKMKTAVFAQLVGAEAVSDSMYFLLLYCFGIGSSLLGIALLRLDKLATFTSTGFIFFGVLSIVAFLNYYAGLTFLSAPVDFSFVWIYPVLQPVSRLSLGIWLWKQARKPDQ